MWFFFCLVPFFLFMRCNFNECVCSWRRLFQRHFWRNNFHQCFVSWECFVLSLLNELAGLFWGCFQDKHRGGKKSGANATEIKLWLNGVFYAWDEEGCLQFTSSSLGGTGGRMWCIEHIVEIPVLFTGCKGWSFVWMQTVKQYHDFQPWSTPLFLWAHLDFT